jgi:hypothetical protein
MKTESKTDVVTGGDKRQVTFSKLQLPLFFFFFLADDYSGAAVLWRTPCFVGGHCNILIEITKH